VAAAARHVTLVILSSTLHFKNKTDNPTTTRHHNLWIFGLEVGSFLMGRGPGQNIPQLHFAITS
jgi:hypothetical protein